LIRKIENERTGKEETDFLFKKKGDGQVKKTEREKK